MWTRSTEQKKKSEHAKIGKSALVFWRNLRFFVVEICVYFVFFKELYACLPKKFAFVFQGNLHFFWWNLRLLFKEICTCFVVEICTCFSMKLEPVFVVMKFVFLFSTNFSLVFRWNFHLWVSRNFGFWRLYSKICEIWGSTQVWKWRE